MNEKSKKITDIIKYLQTKYGVSNILLKDHWKADENAIGLTDKSEQYLAHISTVIKTMKKRLIYTIILALVVLFTAYEELSLRRYLFKTHKAIFIADSLPNFLAAILFIFAYMALKAPRNNREILKPIIFIVLGLVLYEFAQIWMPHMVFDIKDIVASVLGGAISYGVIFLINS